MIHSRGVIPATRPALIEWMKTLPQSWTVAMEATLFTGWIYDFLKPHAFEVKVAHPEMLKAITAAKKKNDQSDAQKICDLLRVDLLPECYMAPSDLRELRRILRYRTYLVRTAVQIKNKKKLTKGNRNRATLAVARKLVAYMLSVEKNKKDFQHVESDQAA